MIVIGVGNSYRRDDGVGPYVVERLRERGVPDEVLAVSDGETTELIDLWDGEDLAVVVDAVRAAPTHPGRIHHLAVADPPAERCRAAHGLDLGEAVELARVLGRLPRRLALYTVEATDIDYGVGLTPAVIEAAGRLTDEIAHLVQASASADTG
ncbi:hydrogenase maturation protease [Planosporangium thailandense]|uniref:Hydrogenase maturation protease n=1 Tax=Planosporangium thailandense TaxID=765197 RepID=A0ABX0Y359_9ACTN|nr:hydrogenase maturation protease [Planosporangium thailandense]NJC72453.1 hydrogenase maturation protease [Planosporangium thailandense]